MLISLATEVPLSTVFLSEFAGTAILLLLGVGVCAALTLPGSKANAAGWICIAFGWGLAVYCGVYVAYRTGAHLNPAVTIGLLTSGAENYSGGDYIVPVTFASTITYIIAQLLGAMLGATLAWLTYRKHYDEDLDAAAKRGTFCTAPAIRSYGWNCVTEFIGTFVLLFVILMFAKTPAQLGPLAVALLIVSIGLSLGGPTGYAINPVRDLGPRIMHAILPIKGKGGSDWAYSWVPVVAPLLGGGAAGLAAKVFLNS